MIKTALKNPVSVIVLAVILFITGMVSFAGMKRESFPEIKIPYIFVTTIYPGANPPEIENLITQKIEDKLDGVDGVKKMTSSSNESVSNIFIEFDPSVKVEDALRRVKDKVDQAKGDLPTDAQDPITQELNFSSIPIANVALYADYDIERLEAIAENLKEELGKIPGILEIKILGKQDREIAIDADPALLQQYDLTLHDIVQAVQTSHRNIPGGTMKTAGYRFSIKVTGELTDPQAFNDLIVRSQNGRQIRVRDVATVSFKYVRDRQSISRTNGKPSLTITVAKRTGEDIVRIVDEAKKVIESSKSKWPAGTYSEVTFDMSRSIKSMVHELENHLIMGMVLVLLVLSFFLGGRNSLFISTAIPFSMGMGFIVLNYMGVTLNMVVLFSLVMALGMLVDDGIVVVENIYRHLQMGKDRFQAALDGTKEVAVPVFTATLTTVGAFAPVLWMPGIMGEFMMYIPLTVGITLSSSLFVAFIFNPVFASLSMRVGDAHAMEGGGEKKGFENFKERYRNLLRWAMVRPGLLLGFCIFFVISGIFAYGKFGPGVVFFPVVEPQVVSAEIEGPLSQDIVLTDSALKVPEQILLSMPDSVASVKTVTSIVGSGKGNRFSGGATETNKGYIDVVFNDYEDRKISSIETQAWMQDSLSKLLPGWRLRVVKQEQGPPTGKPVEIEITGDDYAQLSILADSLKTLIQKIPGLTNVNHDYDPARPEIRIDVDREQAKRFGFSTMDVASAVRGAVFGTEVAKYRVGKNEYKIMVRLAPEFRENISGLNEIIVAKEGKKAPLPSVAVFSQGANIASIKHVGGKRTIQVWGELAPGQKDERAPKKAALEAMKKINPPTGYTIQPGSGNKSQAESQAFIVKAFFIAMSLVFLIMVFQFNSLFQPFLILIGIALSLGGVFWGLLITNKLHAFLNIFISGRQLPPVTFSIMMTGVGIIALAGVVAKNGIVLIDFMNKLRNEGHPIEEAVIEGGATRLRPVLLTAITAMIGLLPMATGAGIDFIGLGIVTSSETSLMWAPMAWAIFWGLLFNTLLVLVITPTFYYAWEHWRAKRRKA
ncbi:MAG: efflux RND transporter permease subunit [Fibrobacteres bacterium]|nr:efflux RND transporter permease subunit [Fibrobacterota bacterium]